MSRAGRIHRTELVALLSQALGDDKASQLIMHTAAEKGLGTFDFSLEEATRVFDELAKTPGLVGITAALAKTRLARLARQG